MQLREFGDQILLKTALRVKYRDITSPEIQGLIADMRAHLLGADAGVALAAPQVGISKRVVVVVVRPTSYRPEIELVDLVMINPRIIASSEEEHEPWEACLSMPQAKLLFMRATRNVWVRVSYYDETGNRRVRVFRDLMAQIAQHEIDHLNGVLFVDRVKDTSICLTKPKYITMLEQSATPNS
jgi:peptide deformylase